MDWADDITYAVHDLVDFYCAGQIPLDRLADESDLSERNSFFSEVFTRCPDLSSRRTELEKIFNDVLEYFPLDRRYIGSLEQRTGIWQFSTVLISRYVNAITLLMPMAHAKSIVDIMQYARDEIRMLKELTWHYVILNNELATLQHGQVQTVRCVFTTMLSAAKKHQWKLFPPAYQEELDGAAGDPVLQTRSVVDYVASMTEHEVTRVYALLTGK
jgi:dGTPase